MVVSLDVYTGTAWRRVLNLGMNESPEPESVFASGLPWRPAGVPPATSLRPTPQCRATRRPAVLACWMNSETVLWPVVSQRLSNVPLVR